MSGVLVLNASYQHHQVVTLKHAAKMLARRVAVVHEAEEGQTFGPFPRPRILRLVRFVYARWLHDDRPRHYSKAAVHKRDGRRCAYCLGPSDTIDHVVPRSQGGQTTWLNTVSCCGDCNQAKDGMTPEQAGMPLLYQPTDPTR